MSRSPRLIADTLEGARLLGSKTIVSPGNSLSRQAASIEASQVLLTPDQRQVLLTPGSAPAPSVLALCWHIRPSTPPRRDPIAEHRLRLSERGICMAQQGLLTSWRRPKRPDSEDFP